MSEQPGQSGPNIGKDSIEMQKILLATKQAEISNRLFESGAASRLAPDAYATDFDREGLAQLDLQYVPRRARRMDGEKEIVVLSMAILKKDEKGTSFAYHDVATLDETDTLFPMPGIERADAEAVHAAANELIGLKAEGSLPNLAYSLVRIEDPYMQIRRMDSPPAV